MHWLNETTPIHNWAVLILIGTAIASIVRRIRQ
jgi:hypothetical protein